MMRDLELTQSQYEAIRDALIAQNVISAAAGQAYEAGWENLLTGKQAEYGVGYVPVLGNVYFADQAGKEETDIVISNSNTHNSSSLSGGSK